MKILGCLVRQNIFIKTKRIAKMVYIQNAKDVQLRGLKLIDRKTLNTGNNMIKKDTEAILISLKKTIKKFKEQSPNITNIKTNFGEKETMINVENMAKIDNGKNDLRNCVPSCYSCNSQKNKKTLNEFYNPENPNYTYEQYYKIYQWIRYDYKNHILPKRRYKGQHISMRIKEIEQSKNK